jgi:MFS family permease
VPLLLSAGSPPTFHDSVRIGLVGLFRMTPLGMVSIFIVGLVTATFFALAPIYAQRAGLDVRQISFFMAAAFVGTVLLQGPIGILSDRFDRRLVLTITTLLTALVAMLCVPAAEYPLPIHLAVVGLFGGLAFPLYSVCIAYINDHLEPNQMIAASGAMILVSGLGAIVGPLLVAMAMDRLGDQALFWVIAGLHAFAGVFAIYRMARKAPIPMSRQGPSRAAAVHPSGSAIESIQQYAHDETVTQWSENEESAP